MTAVSDHETTMTKKEEQKLKKLEETFGYSFKQSSLLKRALTHRSYANEKKLSHEDHNERFEFLGDAVLELAISEFLMNRFPAFSEGDLSKTRAAIVNEKQLAELSRQFELGEYLYLGHGEEQTHGREKASLLADVYEAVLGAIYLDGGWKVAKETVHRHYNRLLDETPVEEFYLDYKTDLQEKCQSRFHVTPKYRLLSEEGPDHDKVFEVAIYIRNTVVGQGRGHSKKEAEQAAAREALKKL